MPMSVLWEILIRVQILFEARLGICLAAEDVLGVVIGNVENPCQRGPLGLLRIVLAYVLN